jgi:MFS family permease
LEPQVLTASRSGFLGLGLSGYHWLVIAAGWAGWGFDMFDAMLFNFVAPNCIPALLHLAPGSRAAHEAAVFWNGTITSLLLVSWAAGGVLFGWVADRIGRKRALFATIAIYAAGTSLCALTTNLWQLILCRTLAGLGIGGEWGVGAALVAEGVPEERRIEAGVIMQTSSPLGVMLASAVNYQIVGVWLASEPQSSWRYVFLAGLLPVVAALGVRLFLRESAHWQASRAGAAPSTPRELFAPGMRRATVSGFLLAVIAILTWWGCNAITPLLGSTLAHEHALRAGLSAPQARLLAAAWQAHASNAFNLGGLVGAFAAVPLARRLGRRPMFAAYFLFSALAIVVTFGTELAPETRLAMLFAVGAGVYGIFGAFTFYLPELFPVRLRATGAGFCYNVGRVLAAGGPFVVGALSAAAGGSSAAIMHILLWFALVPLVAALLARWLVVETRGRALPA